MGIKCFSLRAGIAVALLTTAAACASPPYVYRSNEFDRRQPDYGQEPKSITEVVVCYDSRATTPDEIVRLAEAECARVGRKAAFLRTGYELCPLITPVAAQYVCRDPIAPKTVTQ